MTIFLVSALFDSIRYSPVFFSKINSELNVKLKKREANLFEQNVSCYTLEHEKTKARMVICFQARNLLKETCTVMVCFSASFENLTVDTRLGRGI